MMLKIMSLCWSAQGCASNRILVLCIIINLLCISDSSVFSNAAVNDDTIGAASSSISYGTMMTAEASSALPSQWTTHSQDSSCGRKIKQESQTARMRNLRGPGSSPPQCKSKCGSCTPCKPVHVPLPPGAGTPVTQEYYPEAWRCTCGNRLFIP